jgi:hypothetical protein
MKKIELETLVADLTARLDAVKEEQKAKEAEARKRLTARQKISLTVGSVGIGVLALSVFHCTEALMALTGIDAGMVMCEFSILAAKGDKGRKVRGWSTAYIVLAVVLSCGLNGWASQHNAQDGLEVAAAAVGGLIPVLVFILGKVAGMLWEAE